MAKKHTFLVSDETMNSHGLSVLTEGIDTVQFEKNPIMLYMHQRSAVIGRWENLEKKDGKLYADAVFDEGDEEAMKIAGKVERGFLKSASMGIRILEQNNDSEIVQCMLYEISIVDIGSNGNALRLYDENEFKELNLERFKPSNSLLEILELSHGASQKDIALKIKNIKAENSNIKLKLKKVKTEQENEAEMLIEMATERNLIKPAVKDMYLNLFKDDFYKGKEAIIDLVDVPTISFLEQIAYKKNAYKGKKPKATWGLDEYRKHAPQELEADPELFNQLIQEKFNNN